ncbi:hypothetical protein [Pontibacter liquoris]|uniref:hypothetical protein n=1 Tax=Pontibacter liquoris TaxID=2905677 RepID=UPI001FA6F0A9|nr:hypothetical protein [Pontibacter liquoris]
MRCNFLSASNHHARFYLCLCLGVLLLLSSSAVAQTDTTQVQQGAPRRWVVETNDGSLIQGILLGQDELNIRLRTESAGDITIPKSRVKRLQELDERNFKNGVYWFENPNATRYLFGPSAFSLRKGEMYYQNTYLTVNSFNYGITDNFTLGGGFELISTVTGTPVFFLTPKYTFPVSEKLRAGAGILYLNAANIEEEFSGLGVGYGIVTYGSTDNNATLGLGYGYVDGSFSSKPIITFSGMRRVGRKVGLVTENWLAPTDGYYGIYSYGLRFMGEKLTVDLAFINNPDIAQEIFIGVPYVDFVIKFGR